MQSMYNYPECLIAEWKTDKNTATLDRILKHYDKLLWKMASTVNQPSTGLTRHDMYSEAIVSFMLALELFDLSKNIKFSTYLTHRVHGHLRNMVRDRGSLIFVPSYIQDRASKTKKLLSSVGVDNSISPTDLSKLTGLPVDECGMLLASIKQIKASEPVTVEDNTEYENKADAPHSVDCAHTVLAKSIVKDMNRGVSVNYLRVHNGLSVKGMKKLIAHREYFV